jgi:hypothetical protein
MAETFPESVTDWACDTLVRIAMEHVMARKGARCGICRTRWPCHTYRLATGDPNVRGTHDNR